MARQWFAEGVQVYEDVADEYFVAGVQLNEDQAAGVAEPEPAVVVGGGVGFGAYVIGA